MRNFSRKLNIAGKGEYEFFFHKVFSLSENQRYKVLVRDCQGKSICFDMQRKAGMWKILTQCKLPTWLTIYEPGLHNAILENIA